MGLTRGLPLDGEIADIGKKMAASGEHGRWDIISYIENIVVFKDSFV